MKVKTTISRRHLESCFVLRIMN